MKPPRFLAFVLALVLPLALFTTAWGTAIPAITLGFTPETQAVFLGDSATVEVVISGLGNGGAPSLSTFDLDVTYAPAILAFNFYELGPYLGDFLQGEALDLSFDEIPTGRVNLAELSYLSANQCQDIYCPPGLPPYLDDIQSSSFTLATLVFGTLGIGSNSLGITINALGDAGGNSLVANTNSATITVTPVPEPATLLLLGCGLIGLGMLCKKRETFLS